jgi:murein DD-endopeptidase MepM/ murein hydrolase activator NlpD
MRRRHRFRFALACVFLLPAAAFAAEDEPVIRWFPEAPEQGDALVVEVRTDGPVTRVEGRFIDRDLLFFAWGEDRYRAIVPISVGARPVLHRLTVTIVGSNGDRRQEVARVRVHRHDFDESVLRVDPRFTQPPEEERPRIRRERQMIRDAFAESHDERLWRLPFRRPVEGPRTARFGTRRTFNGELRSRHMGLDLDGKPGDPIYAMADGRVTLAHYLYYAGRAVFVDHGHELFTVYFHMTDIEVETGDFVRAGQRIGTVGASGRVTGPHLHLGVRIQGRYVNPERFLALDLGADPFDGPAEEDAPDAGVADSN